jgi:hypothetical protein
MKRFAFALLALSALAVPAPADAAGKPCGGLRAGGWKASDIRVTHPSCASASTKLRLWLSRGRLPENPVGWNCFRWRGRRTCAVGQGDAPRFTFRLHRGATAAAPIRECGDMRHRLAFNITSRVVPCREARRVVRSWNNSVAQRGGDGRVRGLHCNYRDIGYEAGDIRCTGSRGRVVRWQTYS